jgi:hypothetical protein
VDSNYISFIMYFATLILGALASSTMAGPIQKRSADAGAQSCTAKDHGAYTSYSINIGAAYDADYCNTIYNDLKSATDAADFSGVTNWQCVSDNSDSFEDAGNYQLWFDMEQIIGQTGRTVNEGLLAAFPSDVINGFNCPDY